MKPTQRRKPKRPVRPIHATIRRLRTEQNLSQLALAEMCGLDKTTISHWELGRSAPRWWLMPRVAAALGVTVDELCGSAVQGAL